MLAILKRGYSIIEERIGRKALRYSLTSVVSVLVTQVVLFALYGVFRLFSAVTSNIIATAVAAVPSYYLNRTWAWGKTGRSHLLKEVIPFWALAFLGLWASIETVSYAHAFAVRHDLSHLFDAVLVNFASLFAFGVIWVGKYFIFNRFMFTVDPVLAGEDAID